MKRILLLAAVATSAGALCVSAPAHAYPIVDGISIGDVTGAEPTGTSDRVVTVPVTLSKAYPAKVTVKVSSSNGTAVVGRDFRKVSSTVTFKAGEVSKSVSVRIVGDDVVEPDQTFTLTLSNAKGAPVADGTATFTISADAALPVVSINDAAAVNEPTTSAKVEAVFTVSLSKAWGRTVSVKVTTAVGTASSKDFSKVSTTLTFKAGTVSKTVKVRITKDKLTELVENFTVVLSAPKAATLGDSSGLGTINAN